MWENFLKFLNSITVEPAFFLYTVVFIVVDTTCTNLMLQKKCRFNATSEPDLDTPCDDEKLGILYASEVNSFYRLVMFLLCAIYVIPAMSWSDYAGRRRRPLVLLPIIGLVLQSLSGCVHSYFWTWFPLGSALSNIFFQVVTGGIPLLTLASTTYLCDVSDTKNRTTRLGLFAAIKTLGDLVGFGSAGFVLRSIGFFYTYLLCWVLSLVTLGLAMNLVGDISVRVDDKKSFWRVMNPLCVVDNFKVVFNKRLGKKRIVVSLLLIIFVLVFFTTQGENSVQYLFLRYKFHWDERDFSFYVLYRNIGIVIGNVFCSVVLSKLLETHDALIGVFAGIWDTIAAFGYLFASQNWHLYVVPIFDIFHGAALSVSGSFFSKYYQSEELGRLHSVLGIFALIIPACFPAYHEIFQSTLDVFPSAYCLLSIILDIIVVLFYGATYLLSRNLHESRPFTKEEIPMMASK